MLIHLIKFIHILFTLSLLGTIIYCIAAKKVFQLGRILLLSFGVAVTGTFLVHPQHFNFTTPWIMAAYVLLVVFCIIAITTNSLLSTGETLIGKLSWIRLFVYTCLGIILILIMHDAVTKTTLLF